MLGGMKQYREEEAKLIAAKNDILKNFPSATFENNTLAVEDDSEFDRVIEWLKQHHPEIVAH